MEKKEFKEQVYGGIAQMTRALSNPNRLEIIDLLAQGEKTVEVIATEIRASVANASQHLQVLKQARLVRMRKQGHHAFYSLTDPDVFRAWHTLRALSIRQIAEVGKVVEDFRKERDTLEEMTIEELIVRLRSDDIILLDVRPIEEFERGHIPKAINVPPDTVEEQLSRLPRNKEVVAYCRGPFCVFADDVVGKLKSNGYRAVRLEAGFPDWKLRGLPIGLV